MSPIPRLQINYLIPVDVADADDANLWFQSFEQPTIIDRLSKQAPNATHYVVFDACRNELNLTGPAAKALGAEKGFVPVQHSPGLLIAYATAPKQTASDVGEGGGPYAKVLAEELVKPGIESVSMFRNVQIRVKQAIGQDPWLSFPSLPPVYLAGKEPSPVRPRPSASAAPSPQQVPTFEQRAELAFWETAKDSKDPAVLQAYLNRYPKGAFADLARLLITQAKREAEARQADAAKREAEAQRLAAEQKARSAEAANQNKKLREALEEARRAKEALKAAERDRLAAEKSAEEARRSVEDLKKKQQEQGVAMATSPSPHKSATRPAAATSAAAEKPPLPKKTPPSSVGPTTAMVDTGQPHVPAGRTLQHVRAKGSVACGVSVGLAGFSSSKRQRRLDGS